MNLSTFELIQTVNANLIVCSDKFLKIDDFKHSNYNTIHSRNINIEHIKITIRIAREQNFAETNHSTITVQKVQSFHYHANRKHENPRVFTDKPKNPKGPIYVWRAWNYNDRNRT